MNAVHIKWGTKVLPLDIAADFFNNLSPNIRELLLPEWLQITHKAANLNQSPGNPEAPFGHKWVSWSIEKYYNNKNGGSTSNWKPLS